MKRMSLRTVVIYSVAGLCGAALFYVSQNVQHAEDELRVVQTEMQREVETIRVLKAEWAYLNTPERLEGLAESYLNLTAPASGNIVSTPSLLPSAGQEIFQEISTAPPKERESEVFVTPRKKPFRKQEQKSFDALLHDLGGGVE